MDLDNMMLVGLLLKKTSQLLIGQNIRKKDSKDANLLLMQTQDQVNTNWQTNQEDHCPKVFPHLSPMEVSEHLWIH